MQMPTGCDDLTADFVAEIRTIAGRDLPADVVAIAKLCILDWLGVTIAGADQPPARMLREEIQTSGTGACTVIASSFRASPIDAALLNGVAGDALDYSDCIRAMNGHATATVLPAALAIAEVGGRSGYELIHAFVVGVEAACRVGGLVGEGVLATPFHPTAVVGPFGAAAAAAHLLKLDGHQWIAAMSIAATNAAGLAASVGTMCKPLHAGTAAANGLLAARLAGRGFTGPTSVLERPGGFLAAHTTVVERNALAVCRGRYFIRETMLKQHAACQLAHGSIENMLRLRVAHSLSVGEIARIRLEIAESSARVCDIVAPRTGLEAKFSVRTLAAMALLGAPTDNLAAFDDALVHSPEVVNLRERILVEGRPDLDVAVSIAAIELLDGRVLSAQTDERDLDLDLDRRRARACAKFLTLIAPLMSPQAGDTLQSRVLDLDRAASLVELLRGLPTSATPHIRDAPRVGL
jgi:2-methylcitrate dehydratase PrpD